MRLAVATLADAATVREGLLNVLGAGLTTLYTAVFPAHFSSVFVMVIEVVPDDHVAVNRERVEVTVDVREHDSGEELVRIVGGMEPSDEEFTDFDSTSSTPLIMPLQPVAFNRPGPHRISVSVGDLRAEVRFDVVEGPPPVRS